MGLCADKFWTFFAFLCKDLVSDYMFQIKAVFAKPMVLFAMKGKAKLRLVTHDK